MYKIQYLWNNIKRKKDLPILSFQQHTACLLKLQIWQG
jgi:hypothetical protein